MMKYNDKVWINMKQDVRRIPSVRSGKSDPLGDLYFPFPYVASVTEDREVKGDLLSFGDYCATALSRLIPNPNLITNGGHSLLSYILSREAAGIVASVTDYCVAPVEVMEGHGWPLMSSSRYAWFKEASILVPKSLKDAFVDLFSSHVVDFSSGMFLQEFAYVLAKRKPLGSITEPDSFWSIYRAPHKWLDYEGIKAMPAVKDLVDQSFPFSITSNQGVNNGKEI
jgi:hypothetical protein